MLTLDAVHKNFGGIKATRDVSLDFPKGSLSAIIGPNGAGKTTLFNLISAQIAPSEGAITLDGASIVGRSRTEIVRAGVVRAFQVASLFPTLTAMQAMTAARVSYLGKSFGMWRPFDATLPPERAMEILALLDLGHAANTQVSALSHGDQKLLDIGLALAMEPRVLLLDEPTAGLGPQERWSMIEQIKEIWRALGLTIVFIEHDMDIVFATAQQIHVLVSGAVLASGTPDQVRGDQRVIDAYLGTALDEEKEAAQ
ncbi:ABC transporter ATP-binding protein [Actibacterium mucosum KCTC 23349]|uniref:ABC transporter ATP-binding protein n=1 Tax=Actibacterium mucosum KCTC 23349 TaxID=1454373 RepID=A0A037ZFK8_9RHOB|nr:ABC transporter ATP-binding protein [Actibacterium mucosum]KAJ54383.1 ABC transporter ATP-binding protein [Actibacterium mucosum KCTC 23349]